MKSKNYNFGNYNYDKKIVCIDNSTLYSPDVKLSIIKLLKIGKIYTIRYYDTYNKEVVLDEIPEYTFNINRFVNLSELRKYKLEELNEI